MKIIGISGRREAGKDTLANMLKLHLKGCVLITSTADWPRSLLRQCGVSRDYLDGPRKNEVIPGTTLTGREAQRRLIHLLRTFNVNCLIDRVIENAETVQANWLLMPCVRNLADCDRLREKGGKLIRLTRVVYPEDRYPEEIELDDYTQWDAVIENEHKTPEQVLQDALSTLTRWGWL